MSKRRDEYMSSKWSEIFSKRAEGYSDAYYTNPEQHMEHRAHIVINLGPKISPPAGILELGCGDGFLGCILASKGYRYLGLDVAPGMVEVARKRAITANLDAEFQVGDMTNLNLDRTFHTIFSTMNTFFRYAVEPVESLKQFRPFVEKKIVIDWNHNQMKRVPFNKALSSLQEAGYKKVEWQPCFSPTRAVFPTLVLKLLYAAEHIPLLRYLLIQRKFFALIKGEV
jgi:ubiquinone/menaquinone biosynthesis C-methylase UbiE